MARNRRDLTKLHLKNCKFAFNATMASMKICISRSAGLGRNYSIIDRAFKCISKFLPLKTLLLNVFSSSLGSFTSTDTFFVCIIVIVGDVIVSCSTLSTGGDSEITMEIIIPKLLRLFSYVSYLSEQITIFCVVEEHVNQGNA